MSSKAVYILGLPLFALAGCDSLGLSQAFVIDRLRVLGVAAEPAEPRPGDVVTFTSLVVSPVSPVGLTTWFACSDLSSCTPDPALLEGLTGDPAAMTPEDLAAAFAALQEAGMIGVEPYLSPTWTVPTDYLDMLADADKIEGLPALVLVSAIPTVEGDTATLATAEADIEIAYKRVPVSLATTPNHNPVVVELSIDGVVLAPGAVVTLVEGQTYAIDLALSADSIEEYRFINKDGLEETRTEEPYFSWYLQHGAFDQSNTLWPYTAIEYTASKDNAAEEASAEQSLWVVVRDRRGGMAWAEQRIRVE